MEEQINIELVKSIKLNYKVLKKLLNNQDHMDVRRTLKVLEELILTKSTDYNPTDDELKELLDKWKSTRVWMGDRFIQNL